MKNYQFKITLQGVNDPAVWRVITVPGDFTFHQFHQVIQAAFGWEDRHFYEFVDLIKNNTFEITYRHEIEAATTAKKFDATKVLVSQFFSGDIIPLFYIYDFADSWTHFVELEVITFSDEKTAVCLAGEGACPPENCGGASVYHDLKLMIRTDPNNQEIEIFRDAMGMDDTEAFDPDKFYIEEANGRLREI